MGFMGIPSKNDMNQVITEAPQHLFEGLVKTVAFVPAVSRFSLISGVLPMDSGLSAYVRFILYLLFIFHIPPPALKISESRAAT